MTEKNPQSSYAIVADWLGQLEAKGYPTTAMPPHLSYFMPTMPSSQFRYHAWA
jgi:hypothetical protein